MSKNLSTIVIGTTLAAESDGIVRTGAEIARAAGATPWLVHAYALPAYPSELGSMDAKWIEETTGDLREQMALQAGRTRLAGIAGFCREQSILVSGSPYREIVKLARRLEADLIVVGASEGGALQRTLLGSTADRAVRKAPCPVLVVRSEMSFPPARVVIPVDLSPVSAIALRYGLMFLRDAGRATTEIEVLFVLNPLEVAGSLQFSSDQIERFAANELRRFVAESSPSPVAVRHRILTGYPRDEILAVLAERQADLAILGTHGRSGFERLMVGSVAAEVLGQARCNVLIVPPTATVREERAIADWSYVSDVSPLGAGQT